MAAIAAAAIAGAIAAPTSAAAAPARTRPPQPAAPAAASQGAAPPQAASAALAADRAATQRAHSTGRPVTIASATTQTSVTVASPDGALTMTTHVLPVRVRIRGAWRPVSATLHRTAPGGWSPAATPSGVTLSGGGNGPLAVLASPLGGRLLVSFPARLPAPLISGATATYRSVLPGVDLRVTVSALGGISQALIIRDAAAAANPALRHLRLAIASRLRVTTDAAGNLTAAGPGGQAEFTGPAAMAWDSRTAAAPAGRRHAGAAAASSTAGPGAAARTAAVPVHAAAGTLTLSPPGALLAAAAYPLYLGSAIAPAAFTSKTQFVKSVNSGFTEIKEQCPTAAFWNNSELYGNGTGYQHFSPACNVAAGRFRAYYRIDTTGLDPSMHVQDATLHVTENYGADFNCSDTWPLTVHWTGTISSTTSWSTRPPIDSGDRARTDSVKPGANPGNSSCVKQSASYDVTYAIKLAAAGGWDAWTFGLYGDETQVSSNNGFMRIDHNPDIVTTFDLSPQVPNSRSTTPAAHNPAGGTNNGCNEGTNAYSWLGKADVGADGASGLNLHAAIAPNIDNEDVRADYTMWDNQNNGNQITDPAGTSGHGVWVAGGLTTNTPINFALKDGHQYAWTVDAEVQGIPNGSDGPYTTPAGTNCGFNVDLTAPTQPGVTSTAFPPAGGTTYNGQPGTFSFTSADPVPATGCTPGPCLSSGVSRFAYSLNDAVIAISPQNMVTAAAGAGSVNLTIGDWGTNNLYVEAIDGAGNVSQEFDYAFYVPWNPSQVARPGDIDGDSNPDLLATTSTGGLSLYPGNITTTWPAAVNATASNASPDGTDDWNSYLITHRGSVSHQGFDDLYAIKPGTPNLYLYINNPANQGIDAYGNTANVVPSSAHPACAAPAGYSCASYTTGTWSDVSQILAPGDAWFGDTTTGSGITNDNSQPSLLTVENDQLWLYQGQNGDTLANPIQLGSTGWTGMTLIAPGSVNGQLTLWARQNSTGTIYSYPIFLENSIPTLNPAAPGTPITATSGTILPGFTNLLPASTYPTIASTGDTNTGNGPSLYTIDSAGNIWEYPGTLNGNPAATPTKLTTVTPATILQIS